MHGNIQNIKIENCTIIFHTCAYKNMQLYKLFLSKLFNIIECK